ncbi:MAG: chromosome segregation protein SMC [Gemmataceae bacterium]|nr:chromosome segregation protein SMC [Gemmataceae bacterium]
MLKRLELVGFKSFADKTTFEFSDGLTAIVGPNGSGKSNIVDAVRWILGEQSAKSLRGGEMADVIFNGSSSRRSFGLAEVTMTFDNRRRQLALDMEEVQITRRVYRTGEGEYLINGQISRLKDIKDLFLGSGAGHDAYSIIAQGQVDVLLQTSTKERRTIFEEAAGISRFRAKKIETLRKLERVDQNLSRVKDIIEEVEKQLRSVKLQAAKAQRWHEYSTRLKELRLTLGLDEFRQLTHKLDAEGQALDGLRTELDQCAARAAASEADAERLEIFLADLDDALRDQESRLAQALQEIKTQQTTLAHEAALTADLEGELDQARRRWTELALRVGALAEAVEQAARELAAADHQAEGQRGAAQTLDSALQETERRWTVLQQQIAADQAEHLEQMRRSAHLQNEAVASKAHVEQLERERDRLKHRSHQASESLASVDLELEDLVTADQQLHQRLVAARAALAAQRDQQASSQTLRDQTTEQLSQLRQERSRLASRIDVLEGLIRSHEGLGAGVREVFALLEQPDAGPWQAVLGMIADFLTVKREYAPLIDLALGDWAQRFVVRDVDVLAHALSQRTQPFSGRVSFMPIAQAHSADALAELKTNRLVQVSLLSRVKHQTPEALETSEVCHPGLVAPAAQVVSCEHPELADLVEQLLGRTLIVHDLATARSIAAHAPGYRLVTLHGELLEPDGTLTIGAHHADAGILSRKSELHDLQGQVAAVDATIAQTEQDLRELRDRLVQLERSMVAQQEEIGVIAEQASDLHGRVQRHRERRQGLHEEVTLNRGEMHKLEQDIERLGAAWRAAQSDAAAAEAEVQRLQARLHDADREIRQLDHERQDRQNACTQAQVALATMEERLRALRGQHQQLDRDWRQRQREQAQSEEAQESCKQRLLDSQATMLRASSIMARAYLDKEATQRQVADMIGQRDAKRTERARLVQLAQAVRNDWRVQQESFHARELEVNDLRHQRDTLVDRLREDYQVELADMYRESLDRQRSDHVDAPPTETPALDAAAANEEIAELRRKLGRLGNVNMEALAELEELDTRARDLQTQFDDLTSSKKSLEEIIHKINQDSKRLFLETYQAVRGHFQELFRKLFGGGMADVVLEDENDVLESGIEIVARPPGKELRSISLLSGGEKTLTAVALLLAIFRSKPSPFCVLDEVDAALDEANIDRFTAVLREFLESSQFIIVTHSKKTMAAADVLYGITMQESGVSKQVTIRFEDWVEEEPKSEVA